MDMISSLEPKLSEQAKGATTALASFASRLQFTDLPIAVVNHAKLLALDAIGCCLYGSTLPWTRKLTEMIKAEGGSSRATVLGAGFRTSVSQAVLANSTAGHAFESDDLHKASLFHPGSICFPVALACGESRGRVAGKEIISSMVAGYEVGARVGMAATMGLFFRGWHPQGTSGTFVSAASAANMLRLNEERTLHALGIAASQASGLMSAQEGAMVKRMHSGRAAQSGVYGALLAQLDFTGIVNVLEADFGGFLSTLSDKLEPARLTSGLGEEWETLQVGFKFFTSCGTIQASMDALRQIMRSNNIKADEIAEVEARVSTMTYVHCAWEYKAQGVTAAQMNLFYGLAVMAIDGNAFVDQYREERLKAPAILQFIKRIKAYPDQQIDDMGPAFRSAGRIKVKCLDGRVFEKEVLHRLGTPENALSAVDVENKFHALARQHLSDSAIDNVIEIVNGLDRLEDIRPLVAVISENRNH